MKVDNRIIAGVSVLAVAAVFLWGRSCGVKSVIRKVGKPDTTFIKLPPVTITVEKEKLKPVAVIKYLPGRVIVDTEFVEKPLPTDTAGIIADYYRTYAYEYTDKIGPVTITLFDTVSQNMFFGRGLKGVIDSLPVAIRTDTLIINEAEKMRLYGSLSGMGSKSNIGGGAGFALKLPNEKIYELEIKRFVGEWIVEGTVFIPIGKKKKK